MAQTLLEIQKLLTNDIISGVAETVINVNPLFEMIPAYGFAGKAVQINEHTVGTNATFYAEGAVINPAVAETLTPKFVSAVSLIVDADISQLSIAVGSSVDPMAFEVMEKARDLGQKLQNSIINGSGVGTETASLFSEVAVVNNLAPVDLVLGDALTFNKMDEILDLVKSKNGRVDFILMSFKMRRKFRTLLRSLGGNALDQITTVTGAMLDSYEGIPIFVSDFKTSTELLDGTALVGGAHDSVYAGVFDSGNLTDGISLIYPQSGTAGFEVQEVGIVQNQDVIRNRVKWYGNFVVANPNALVRAHGIDPTL